MIKNYKPKSTVLPPRKGQAIDYNNKANVNTDIDSVIINEQ